MMMKGIDKMIPQASRPMGVALVIEFNGKHPIEIHGRINLQNYLSTMCDTGAKLIARYRIDTPEEIGFYAGEVTRYLQSRKPGKQLTRGEIDAFLVSERQSTN